MASTITSQSTRPRMRLLMVLFTLAVYMITFSAAAAIDFAVERRRPLGANGGGFNFDLARDHFTSGQKDHGTTPFSSDRTNGESSSTKGTGSGSSSSSTGTKNLKSLRSQCGTGTAVGTMWIADRAYTCAPVNGQSSGNYCVSTSLSDYDSGLSLCNKHSDCGSDGWCIKVKGQSSVCWISADGCDSYYHGKGTPL